MGRIFLSYAREDRAFADRVARQLERAGHRVWWDRHIDSGREFASQIEAEIESAELVLVAWSATAAKSPWVRDEAAIGRDRGKLLPVLVDGSQPPIGFRQLQALDLHGWKARQSDRRTKALLDAVSKTISTGSIEAGRAEPRPRWRARGRAWAMAAALSLLLAAGVGLYLLQARSASSEPASLAVLPFRNMAAGDPYFAEGVAEEIAGQLSREPQFKVAGRTSSALFKDAADLREVGRRLHVAYVLEGSVRSAGKQVQVEVTLVDVKGGMRLWSREFRGNLDDIFAIQDNIGEEVAAHVKRQLVAHELASAMKANGEVYSLYVTARSLMHLREPAKLAAAADLLRSAVKLDPGYAPAWAQLALATQLVRYYGHEDEEGADLASAESLADARRAIALAPDFARGHAILGLLESTGDAPPDQARHGDAELERSVQLDPNDAEAWYWLHGRREAKLDFEGALHALERTAAIDPFFVFSSYYPPLAWSMGDHRGAMQFLELRARDHPSAYIREQARAMAAGLRNDQSEQYRYSRAARDIAPADMRNYDEVRMGSVLLHLRMPEQAKRYVPPMVIELAQDRLPSRDAFREFFPSPSAFWRFNADEEHLLPRVMLKLGWSDEIIQAYDETFKSPGDMAGRYPRYGFVLTAPLIAIALRQQGRGREGVRMLFIADGMCRGALRAGRSPASFRVMCARVSTLLGRTDEALRTLEQAVAEGWRPTEGEYSLLGDEPALAGIRDNPRLKRIDARFSADIARERRELLAGGL